MSKDRMFYISESVRIAGLKQAKQRKALYYNVVDALDNILLSHNSPSYCQWWIEQNGLNGKVHIRSIR